MLLWGMQVVQGALNGETSLDSRGDQGQIISGSQSVWMGRV